MTNLAQPAIEEIHAWYNDQNPLIRALTFPLIERVENSLNAMQRALDDERALREHSVHTLGEQVKSAQQQLGEQAAEHAVVLRTAIDRIDQLERKTFGQSSEKRRGKTPDGQDGAQKRRRKELSEEEKKAQREAAQLARQKKLDALRTEYIELQLAAEVAAGRALPPETSVLYEWRRGELVRLVIRREQRVLPDGQIVTAPPPSQVVEKGSYGPALHAKVVVDKCLDGLPLRRQERAFERMGIPLSIAVLCALFHRSAESIKPLYLRQMMLLRDAEHVSADETPQPVQDEEKARKGWMWVFSSGTSGKTEPDPEDGVVFVFSPSRGGKVAEKVLGTSQGTLTVDAYAGYNLVSKNGGRERGGCWSHARRGLFEAKAHDPVLVEGLVAQIGELFYTEYLAMEQRILGTAEHLALRQQRSQPVITKLYQDIQAVLDAQKHDERSSIAKALRYIVNQKQPLTLFLKNARVPIHNNHSERALRVVALLRKNALFVGHDEAGENLAILLSMTATCLLHGVNPEVWLADVLIAVGEPGLSADDLLPGRWKFSRGPTVKPLYNLGPHPTPQT